MKKVSMPSLTPNDPPPEQPQTIDKSPRAMHKRFVKRMTSALTHSTAIFSTVLCLTLGGGLIYDAATTNPTRFYANLGDKDTSVSLFTLSLDALSLPHDERVKKPQPASAFQHVLNEESSKTQPSSTQSHPWPETLVQKPENSLNIQ